MRARVVIAVAAATVIACTMIAQPAFAANSASSTCQRLSVPVALTPGGADNQTISGTLCEPANWSSGPHQVDVLVHGYTYNSSYWDWPQDPSMYSYVDKDLAAGRATFAYDRLGDGTSSHPTAIGLTPQGDAYDLHEIVQLMRTKYPEVNIVGHSWGSYLSLVETNQYNDANRLVITGLLHAEGPSFVLLQPSLYPANLDPQFANLPLDLAYVTTLPGTRNTLFYHDADPAVVAYDEAHKDLGGETQLVLGALQHFILSPVLNSETENITRPVLLIDGQEDGVFCGLLLNCTNQAAVTANETPYYPKVASLSVVTVPNTGHDLALHPSANTSFADINAWMETH